MIRNGKEEDKKRMEEKRRDRIEQKRKSKREEKKRERFEEIMREHLVSVTFALSQNLTQYTYTHTTTAHTPPSNKATR